MEKKYMPCNLDSIVEKALREKNIYLDIESYMKKYDEEFIPSKPHDHYYFDKYMDTMNLALMVFLSQDDYSSSFYIECALCCWEYDGEVKNAETWTEIAKRHFDVKECMLSRMKENGAMEVVYDMPRELAEFFITHYILY